MDAPLNRPLERDEENDVGEYIPSIEISSLQELVAIQKVLSWYDPDAWIVTCDTSGRAGLTTVHILSDEDEARDFAEALPYPASRCFRRGTGAGETPNPAGSRSVLALRRRVLR
jgi:hypothetical protein